jgi:hypothetical protein
MRRVKDEYGIHYEKPRKPEPLILKDVGKVIFDIIDEARRKQLAKAGDELFNNPALREMAMELDLLMRGVPYSTLNLLRNVLKPAWSIKEL